MDTRNKNSTRTVRQLSQLSWFKKIDICQPSHREHDNNWQNLANDIQHIANMRDLTCSEMNKAVNI